MYALIRPPDHTFIVRTALILNNFPVSSVADTGRHTHRASALIGRDNGETAACGTRDARVAGGFVDGHSGAGGDLPGIGRVTACGCKGIAIAPAVRLYDFLRAGDVGSITRPLNELPGNRKTSSTRSRAAIAGGPGLLSGARGSQQANSR